MTDIEDAQKMIAEANRQADIACEEEIQAVLKKYRRNLIVTNIGLTPEGWMQPQITIVPARAEADC